MMKQIHKTLVLAGSFAALLSLGGCATTALVDGGRGAVLPDKATVQNELQGRAFTLGRVYLDITKPTDKSSHVLPDDAYVKLLRSQLETAFRNAGLSQGKQPAYSVDVAINEMRFVNGSMPMHVGVLKATPIVHNERQEKVVSVPLRAMDGGSFLDVNPGKENMAHRFNIPGMGVLVTHLLESLRSGKTVESSVRGPVSWYLLNKTNNYGLHMLSPEETERLAGIRLDDYR
ncbi:MAG: hypothetical protein ACOY5C_00290 [Pseudomonadota bacterium]